jgi:hypothetical protein
LHKELNSTNAYSETSASEKDIVNNHITNISNLKVQINEKELKLPIMYWIPKLNKKKRTKQDLLLILHLALQVNFLFY